MKKLALILTTVIFVLCVAVIDLNCKDVDYRNFQVLGPDPYGFDRDHDGIGCEKK